MNKLTGDHIEKFLVITLSGFAVSVFFSQTGIGVFGLLSIAALLIWRFYLKYEPLRRLPKSLVIATWLFLLSLVVGVLLSDYHRGILTELGKYRHIFLAGLLFTAPMSSKNRKIIIIVFFLSAAIEGLIGILQYYDLVQKHDIRPHGFDSHPIIYATKLALVCGSGIFLFSLQENSIFKMTGEKLFLLAVVILTFGGILLSLSRGAWIALFLSCMITISIYNYRKAFYFLFVMMTLFIITVSYSSTIRQRVVSTVTSVSFEYKKNSTDPRIELWKGAFLIFKENPFLGTGSGDFESDIKRLIAEKKLQETPVMMHAHNIFLQSLATRGLTGALILAMLFAALISWGIKEIRGYDNAGGYIIILITVLTLVGGLTEFNIEKSKFFAAFCFELGLIGTNFFKVIA